MLPVAMMWSLAPPWRSSLVSSHCLAAGMSNSWDLGVVDAAVCGVGVCGRAGSDVNANIPAAAIKSRAGFIAGTGYIWGRLLCNSRWGRSGKGLQGQPEGCPHQNRGEEASPTRGNVDWRRLSVTVGEGGRGDPRGADCGESPGRTEFVECRSSSVRILRCMPNGGARPCSQRFSVEYVIHRK